MTDDAIITSARLGQATSTHRCHHCDREQPPDIRSGPCVYCRGTIGPKVTDAAIELATLHVFREHPEFNRPGFLGDETAISRASMLTWCRLRDQGYCIGPQMQADLLTFENQNP